MASYTLDSTEVGIYDKALAAGVEDTVTLTRDQMDPFQTVTVINDDGGSSIYFTLDGSTPTVGGTNCYRVFDVKGAMTTAETSRLGTVVVRLISAVAVRYSLMGER